MTVNVDALVWTHPHVAEELVALLRQPGRPALWANALRVLRALTEAVAESRAAIGRCQGLFPLLAELLGARGAAACALETVRLLDNLSREEPNVPPPRAPRPPRSRPPLTGHVLWTEESGTRDFTGDE